ncbi:biliverdin-producing heme oxygenase [Hymenobacter sp. BT491]|uniref:biliverdin-producing heme oxygenase n=1 Tax=Hymenobacter sp. BT491 TaxID=2766779 RepID=UPI00165347DB|nr:biliverdin-producing heme oxygenase [Hymenobacter sp. BT491]MBC6989247.1 biliverdin-producing heme oxygenase [Hymenobacter sp. BT491]
MSITLENTSILQRLRSETHASHDALEQNEFNQALTAGHISAEATRRFLAKLYGFLQPYEAQLSLHTFPAAWEVEHRRRAHLILEDLQPTSELPLCPDMPPLRTWPQVLGAMYVLEGSTLGGQVITRQLAKAGIATRTYFTGYGERTGPMWKSFCQLLTEAANEANQAEIVQSAILTFQKLHAWIDQP